MGCVTRRENERKENGGEKIYGCDLTKKKREYKWGKEKERGRSKVLVCVCA